LPFRMARLSWLRWRLAYSRQHLVGQVALRGATAFFRRCVRGCVKTWRARAGLQRALRRVVAARLAACARTHFAAWRARVRHRGGLARLRARADRMARTATATRAVAVWRWAWRCQLAAAAFSRRRTLRRAFLRLRALVRERVRAEAAAGAAAAHHAAARTRACLAALAGYTAARRVRSARRARAVALHAGSVLRRWRVVAGWSRLEGRVERVGRRMAARKVLLAWARTVARAVRKRVGAASADAHYSRVTLGRWLARARRLGAIRRRVAQVHRGGARVPLRGLCLCLCVPSLTLARTPSVGCWLGLRTLAAMCVGPMCWGVGSFARVCMSGPTQGQEGD
jgi:hypothetical protein